MLCPLSRLCAFKIKSLNTSFQRLNLYVPLLQGSRGTLNLWSRSTSNWELGWYAVLALLTELDPLKALQFRNKGGLFRYQQSHCLLFILQ